LQDIQFSHLWRRIEETSQLLIQGIISNGK